MRTAEGEEHTNIELLLLRKIEWMRIWPQPGFHQTSMEQWTGCGFDKEIDMRYLGPNQELCDQQSLRPPAASAVMAPLMTRVASILVGKPFEFKNLSHWGRTKKV